MKISKLLLNEDKGYETSFTGYDPELNKYSWDVEYSNLYYAIKALDQAVELLGEATKEHQDDKNLAKYHELLSKTKKAFKSYITRKYGQ